MTRAIVSIKNELSEKIVKEAKKKAIDQDLSFTDAVLKLLDKWVNNEVEIQRGK